jgi:predicted nucleic acid-binding protein
MALVIDASVAVEYLLRTNLGQRVAGRIEREDLVAPELLDAEVLAVFRRAWLAKKLTPTRSAAALEDLVAWQVRRVPHVALVREAWNFRQNVSAYDALYLATGHLFDAPVLTADGPLSRAPRTGVVVENVRA